MRDRRCLYAVPIFGALMFASLDANAQSVPSVTSINAIHVCDPAARTCRDAPTPGIPLSTVNDEECSDDLVYRFDLGFAYPSSAYSLEAWVGQVDCTVLANRQAGGGCWPVVAPSAPTTSPSILDVRMQDIAATAFAATHATSYTPTTDASVCTAQQRTVYSDETLYLFWVDPAGNAVGVAQPYPMRLDLRAGLVGGAISIGEADGGVTAVEIPETTDPDVTGYNVYCDPPPAVIDSEASAPPGCSPSDALTAGGEPMAKYLCATGLGSQTSIEIGSVIHGHAVNVAVAATDWAGNVGVLSNVICSSGTTPPAPQDSCAADGTCKAQMQDVAAGGTGSAGSDLTDGRGVSCAVSTPGGAGSTGGAGALLAAALFFGARRRRNEATRA